MRFTDYFKTFQIQRLFEGFSCFFSKKEFQTYMLHFFYIKSVMAPFHGVGCTCLKIAEPLPEEKLLLTNAPAGVVVIKDDRGILKFSRIALLSNFSVLT